MNIDDVNLDAPISEEDRLTAALAGVMAAKQDAKNLLARIEAIENWILNNSIPQYRPPDSDKHIPLGKVLDDLYSKLGYESKR